MSAELRLDHVFIQGLADSAAFRYRESTIPKRNGGLRTIYSPSRELKALQRWVVRRVLSGLAVHPAAMAYREGADIRRHAAVHVKARFLLRMDLRDFFHSITSADICAFASTQDALKSWTADDLTLFCKIVCRWNRLVIGAVTSPGLSNALCFSLDENFAALSDQHGCSYTRYADDLYFSSGRPQILRSLASEVPGILASVPYPAGLRVNWKKTKHSSRATRMNVTGLRITNVEGISVGRAKKRWLRSLVYSFDKLDLTARRSVVGHLAQVQAVEPDFVNRLIQKFGAERVLAIRRFGA